MKNEKVGRSSWKGHIQFSLISIPVKAYNAVDEGNKVSFNQLHNDCGGKIRHDKRCEKCERTKLSTAEIVKGYDMGGGNYVIMDDDELKAVKIPSNKVIEITAFVDTKEISATHYSAPYCMGPDGDVANRSFALLAEALKKTKKAGIGKFAMRDREVYVAILADGGQLYMHLLRRPEEIKNLDLAPDRKVDKDELKLASDLIASMTTKFEEIEIEADRYNEKLREVILAKSAGKTIKIEDIATEQKPVADIMEILKASLEKQKKTA